MVNRIQRLRTYSHGDRRVDLARFFELFETRVWIETGRSRAMSMWSVEGVYGQVFRLVGLGIRDGAIETYYGSIDKGNGE